MILPTDVLPSHSHIRTSEEVAAAALHATKEWLPTVDLGDPTEVVEFRSRVIDILFYARTDGLGTDAILDIQEIARRCERWIATAIRHGQKKGRIRAPGNRDSSLISTEHFAGVRIPSTLSPYYVWLGLSEEAFENLLLQGRSNGTLAQMPLMRIARGLLGVSERADRNRQRIVTLAERQMTTRQIARAMRMSTEGVSRIIAAAGIEIPADQVTGKNTRHIDPERIVRETVAALEGMAIGLRMLDRVDFEELDTNEVEQWLQSLDKSLPTIASLKKELRRAKSN